MNSESVLKARHKYTSTLKVTVWKLSWLVSLLLKTVDGKGSVWL